MEDGSSTKTYDLFKGNILYEPVESYRQGGIKWLS